MPENITAICSPRIEKLLLQITNEVDNLTVNCLKLRQLHYFSITNNLRVNGILFKELSSNITELFMDPDGTVVDMELQPTDGTNNLWAEKCAEITETFKFLEYLYIDHSTMEEKMDIPTTKLLQGLPRLQRLYISGVIDLVRIFFILHYIICWCLVRRNL